MSQYENFNVPLVERVIKGKGIVFGYHVQEILSFSISIKPKWPASKLRILRILKMGNHDRARI